MTWVAEGDPTESLSEDRERVVLFDLCAHDGLSRVLGSKGINEGQATYRCKMIMPSGMTPGVVKLMAKEIAASLQGGIETMLMAAYVSPISEVIDSMKGHNQSSH